MLLRLSTKVASVLALLSMALQPVAVNAATITPSSGATGSYGGSSYAASQQAYQQMWNVPSAGYGSSLIPGGYVYNPGNKVGATGTTTYSGNKVGSSVSGVATYVSNKLPNYASGSNQVPSAGGSYGNQVPSGTSGSNQVPSGGSYGTYSSSNLPNFGGGNYGSSAVPGGYVYNPGNKVASGGSSGSSVGNKLPSGSGSSVGNQVPSGSAGGYPTYSSSNLPNYGGGNYGSSLVPGGYVYNPGNKVPNGGAVSDSGNKVPNGSSDGSSVGNKVPNGGTSDSGVGNKVPNGSSDGSSVGNKVPNGGTSDSGVDNKVPNTDDGGVNNKVPNTDDGGGNNKVPNRDTDGDGEDDISLCNDRPYPSDIDNHWAEIYVRRLYDLCIIEGYADGKFKPEQNVTRAELTKMALYSKGITPILDCYDADCGSPFNDLDMWQGPWVRKAWDLKIVQGYSKNIFKPNRSITRAEAVKVVLATYGYSPMNVSKSFFNDVSGWSTGWIERAHEIGMVQGIGNGNFDPDRPITRAEAAKIIAKMMEYWDTKID